MISGRLTVEGAPVLFVDVCLAPKRLENQRLLQGLQLTDNGITKNSKSRDIAEAVYASLLEMDSSNASASSNSSMRDSDDDKHLQECFVLRRGSSVRDFLEVDQPSKPKRKSELDFRTGRKGQTLHSLPPFSKDEHALYGKWRMEAFTHVWSRIETAIKDVLLELDISTFEEIHRWIHNSHYADLRSKLHCSLDDKSTNIMPKSPVVKQLATALLFIRNVEFVDDRSTFGELGSYMKCHNCHVANMTPQEISLKAGLGGCVHSLLRQIVKISPDTPDMEILASWHHEPANRKDPVVIIIEDVERCHSSVLAEFINLLSEWVVQIPVVLVMGMATTVDALRKLLPSSAIQHLHPQRFNLKYPLERLEAVLTAVMIESFCGFYIGHKVAKFLYNFFLRQDGTVTSFLRALKIACMEHFYTEPLSFLCNELVEDKRQEDWENICNALPDAMLKYAAELPSVQFEHKCEDKAIGAKLAAALLDIKIVKQKWSTVLLCLHEAGKYARIRLADLFCEALCPLSPLKSKTSCQEMHNGRACGSDTSGNVDLHSSSYSDLTNGKFIGHAVKKLRDLSLPLLASLLKEWEKLTKGMTEINIEIHRLQSIVGQDLNGDNAEGNFTGVGCNSELMNRLPYNMEGDLDTVSERVAAISQDFSGDITNKPQTSKVSAEKLLARASFYGGSSSERGDLKAVNDMAMKLLERMVRECLRPIESMPFHEIICYKQVNALQSALMGDTRKTVQNDLLNFQSSLQCGCCRGLVGLSSSMHDTSLAYNLAQEHGDVINVHDWYESFGAIVSGTDLNKEYVEKKSSEKKRKAMGGPPQTDKASIQARFSKAITELQIVGLLRMPSKRRPDYIQRIAFGL